MKKSDENKKDLHKMWLTGLVVLVFVMITIGGATRLTRSGLSIVEWRPVTGILPPLSEAAWEKEFQKYQLSPEFQKVNSHFTLDEYKKIYFWEYFHRLMGRLIFFYTLVPGIILWRRREASGRLVLALNALVLVQGLMGWIMVKSGLQYEPRVSPFFLAAHFFLAVLLMVIAYYHAIKSRAQILISSTQHLKSIYFMGVLLLIQIFFGCLTSGYKAGYYSSTFPLMHDKFFPAEQLLSFGSLLTNVFYNPQMIHWIHRWLGIAVAILIYVVCFMAFRSLSGQSRRPFLHLVGITTTQIFLGISLILFHVPLWLALAHQAFAALIVLGYCNILFRLTRS